METQCPFLKEQKVAFCRAFPVRKMLPFDRLYLEEDLCLKEEHTRCSLYQEKEKGKEQRASSKRICPFVEVEEVLYCEVYPVKKMIPASTFKLECPCTTAAYIHCPAYRQIAEGDRASGETVTVRGFLLDDTVYYHRGHLWLQQVNGKLRVGLDDFGRWLLGDIEKITFPRRKGRVERKQPLVRIHCAQGTAEISAPLAGTVVGVNEGLNKDSSPISANPYGLGWLVELRPAEGELARLGQQTEGFFSGPDARRWLEGEVDQLHSILATEIGVTMSDGGELLSSVQEAIDPRQWGMLIENFLAGKEE